MYSTPSQSSEEESLQSSSCTTPNDNSSSISTTVTNPSSMTSSSFSNIFPSNPLRFSNSNSNANSNASPNHLSKSYFDSKSKKKSPLRIALDNFHLKNVDSNNNAIGKHPYHYHHGSNSRKNPIYPNHLNDDNDSYVLPPGWTTAIQVTDGRMYYWNVRTGETSWIRPEFRMTVPEETKVMDTNDNLKTKDQNLMTENPLTISQSCSSDKNDIGLYQVPQESLLVSTNHNSADTREINPGLFVHCDEERVSSSDAQYPSDTVPQHMSYAQQVNRSLIPENDVRAVSPTKHDIYRSSFNFQSPAPSNASKPRSPLLVESPNHTRSRPESHTCCALLSTIVFPPLGLYALYHSLMVKKSWSEGRVQDAIIHSRQSYNYAWFGGVVFFVLFIYFTVSDKEFILFK